MTRLLSRISEHGYHMEAAGMALDTVGELLGADGSEHNLLPNQVQGLNHAVVALAALVKQTGAGLCTMAAEAEHDAAQAEGGVQ